MTTAELIAELRAVDPQGERPVGVMIGGAPMVVTLVVRHEDALELILG